MSSSSSAFISSDGTMEIEVGKVVEVQEGTWYVHCKWCREELWFGVEYGREDIAKEYLQETMKWRESMKSKTKKWRYWSCPECAKKYEDTEKETVKIMPGSYHLPTPAPPPGLQPPQASAPPAPPAVQSCLFPTGIHAIQGPPPAPSKAPPVQQPPDAAVIDELRAEVHKLKGKVDELDTEIEFQVGKIAQLERKADQLEAEVALRDQRVDQLERKSQILEAEVDQLKIWVARNEELENLKCELEKLKQEIGTQHPENSIRGVVIGMASPLIDETVAS